MAKNKRVAFYLEEEWLKALSGLAGTFGVSAEEVIRRSLPDVAATELFFRCKIFAPDLQWDQVSEVGRDAIRERLRATYMKGLEEHLARLGVNLQSSADEVEAARQRALAEMRADTTQPLEPQLAKARDDSVYLGYLYDAWKRAKAGQPRYATAQIDMVDGPDRPGAAPPQPRKVWAVLKDGQPV